MTRVLVTGGGGFIGRHLVRELVGLGYEVRVLDNLLRGSFDGIAPAEVIEGDIRDLETCIAAADGCELVVHLAAQSNVMGSQADAQYSVSTNVLGTWNVAHAAITARADKFIFASSREVYGDAEEIPVREDSPTAPRNTYGATKLAAESLLRGIPPEALEVVVLRFSNIIGPGDSNRVVPLWLDAAATNEPLTLFGGQQLMDFLSVHTAVDAIVAAATLEARCPTPINVASGTGTTLVSLAERICRISGSSSGVCFAPARAVEVTRFVGDTARMRTVLGVKPPDDPLAVVDEMIRSRSALRA